MQRRIYLFCATIHLKIIEVFSICAIYSSIMIISSELHLYVREVKCNLQDPFCKISTPLTKWAAYRELL